MNQKKLKIIKAVIHENNLKSQYPQLKEIRGDSVKQQLGEFIRDQFQGAAQSFKINHSDERIEIMWGIPKEYSQADELNKEALELAKAKQFMEATQKWQQAVKIDPMDPDLHYNIGLAFYQAGNFDQGIEECQEAVNICPVYYKSYFVLGSLYSRKRLYKDAEQVLRKGLLFQPQNVNGLINLGAVYSVLKKNSEAKKWFETALRYSPDEIKAYFGLGKIYAAEKDYENANRCLKAVIKLDPEGTMGMLAKRSIHAMDDVPIKAANRTETKADSQEIDVEQTLAQGYSFYLENNIEAAVEKYSIYLKYEKSDADIWASLASCYYRLKQYDNALCCIKRSIKINPGKPFFYKFMAMMYDTIEESDQAGEAAQKAFSLGKRDSVVLTLLGIAKKDKHLTESTQLLQEAVSLDSNNLKARFHLGTILERDNQTEAANQQFEEILWSDIESPLKANARKHLKLKA